MNDYENMSAHDAIETIEAQHTYGKSPMLERGFLRLVQPPLTGSNDAFDSLSTRTTTTTPKVPSLPTNNNAQTPETLVYQMFDSDPMLPLQSNKQALPPAQVEEARFRSWKQSTVCSNTKHPTNELCNWIAALQAQRFRKAVPESSPFRLHESKGTPESEIVQTQRRFMRAEKQQQAFNNDQKEPEQMDACPITPKSKLDCVQTIRSLMDMYVSFAAQCDRRERRFIEQQQQQQQHHNNGATKTPGSGQSAVCGANADETESRVSRNSAVSGTQILRNRNHDGKLDKQHPAPIGGSTEHLRMLRLLIVVTESMLQREDGGGGAALGGSKQQAFVNWINFAKGVQRTKHELPPQLRSLEKFMQGRISLYFAFSPEQLCMHETSKSVPDVSTNADLELEIRLGALEVDTKRKTVFRQDHTRSTRFTKALEASLKSRHHSSAPWRGSFLNESASTIARAVDVFGTICTDAELNAQVCQLGVSMAKTGMLTITGPMKLAQSQGNTNLRYRCLQTFPFAVGDAHVFDFDATKNDSVVSLEVMRKERVKLNFARSKAAIPRQFSQLKQAFEVTLANLSQLGPAIAPLSPLSSCFDCKTNETVIRAAASLEIEVDPPCVVGPQTVREMVALHSAGGYGAGSCHKSDRFVLKFSNSPFDFEMHITQVDALFLTVEFEIVVSSNARQTADTDFHLKLAQTLRSMIWAVYWFRTWIQIFEGR